MRPGRGEVLHFSEDPTITRVVPHVAATARQSEPYVWTVDAANSPSHWFPRQCPRAMAWLKPSNTDADRDRRESSSVCPPISGRSPSRSTFPAG